MKFLLLMLLGAVLCAACGSLNTVENDDDAPPPRRTAERKSEKDEKASKEKTASATPTEARNPAADSKSEDNSLKKKVLVLRFLNKSLYGGEELSSVATWEASDLLAQSADFFPVGQETIPGSDVFANAYGDYNYPAIFEKARAHGISAVISGSVDEVQIQEKGDEVGVFRTRFNSAAVAVKFQLFDVATERSLFTKVQTAEVTDETTRFFGSRTPESFDAARARGAVKKALEDVMAILRPYAKRINWVGRIARIDLHRYYINAGEASGIEKGQLLKVFTESAPVTDQQTGEIIGLARGRFKGLLKVIDFFGADGTVAVVHSGAGFREQDPVEIYSPQP